MTRRTMQEGNPKRINSREARRKGMGLPGNGGETFFTG
jgi:hypothetical protein